MKLSRQEFAQLLNVQERYLCPSNYEHYKAGAEECGYRLISRSGRGAKTIFELEPIDIEEYSDEEWKPLPIAPLYLVSNKGRIKSPKGGLLKGYNHKGYIRTQIAGLGQVPNHRMVMLTFNPIDHPEDFVVDHINGVRNDNRVENLRWVWQSENFSFAIDEHTDIKEIIAKLVQKYGYDKLKQKLEKLLE